MSSRPYMKRGSASKLVTAQAVTVESAQTSLPLPTGSGDGAAAHDGWTDSDGFRADDYYVRIIAAGAVTLQSAHLLEWNGTTWDDLGLINNGQDIVLSATRSFKQDLFRLDGSRLAVSGTLTAVVAVTVTVGRRLVASE